MGKPNQFTAKEFIDAIPGSGGIITVIAKRVACKWHTAKKYCQEYATVAKAYRDECESVTDLAESAVLKAIQSGDVGAAKWYLTMKARSRGYIRSAHFEFEDKPHHVLFEWTDGNSESASPTP